MYYRRIYALDQQTTETSPSSRTVTTVTASLGSHMSSRSQRPSSIPTTIRGYTTSELTTSPSSATALDMLTRAPTMIISMKAVTELPSVIRRESTDVANIPVTMTSMTVADKSLTTLE